MCGVDNYSTFSSYNYVEINGNFTEAYRISFHHRYNNAYQIAHIVKQEHVFTRN